jgi:putative sigma-54 modulation protein
MGTIKCNIQSIHFDADKKLIELIEKKVNKLSRFFDNIIEAQVFLKLEDTKLPENKVVEIRLAIPGNDVFAKRTSEKFEIALDEVVEALRRQLKKKKEE